MMHGANSYQIFLEINTLKNMLQRMIQCLRKKNLEPNSLSEDIQAISVGLPASNFPKELTFIVDILENPNKFIPNITDENKADLHTETKNALTKFLAELNTHSVEPQQQNSLTL